MDYSGRGGRRRCSENPQPDPDRTNDNLHHNEPLSLDDHHSQSAAVSDDDFYYYQQVSSFLQHHTTDHQSLGWAFQPPIATTSTSPPVLQLPLPFPEADEPTGSSGSSLINPGAFHNTASALDGSTSTPAATATTSVSSSESEDQPHKSVVGTIRAEGVVEKSADNTF